MKLISEEIERYKRQIPIEEFGKKGQEKLKSSSVLIVGMGGLGSAVSTSLNAVGIGKIGLIDGDEILISNLNRQTLYSHKDLKNKKVNVAKKKLKEQNIFTKFIIYDEFLNYKNAKKIIKEYDVIVDCTDNFETRHLLDEICFELNKIWVYGSVYQFEGQISVFHKNRNFKKLHQKQEKKILEENYVIGLLPSIVGGLQANEVLKILLGIGNILKNKLLIFNILKMKFYFFKI
ncbi:MAG: hypothetical protein B6I24_04605 [Bacteroidetes bacterium 4572_128]|nr:MAG: hypothetical protein B6I24_04605 [Bacteroidetes bacterium 4572_128]